MDKRSIERDRDDQIMPAPTGQDLEESIGPWRTEGCMIQDADGHTIAVADREADARLMAAAPRMAGILWVALDGGLIDQYFQDSVEEALRDAGRELPVQGGSDGGK